MTKFIEKFETENPEVNFTNKYEYSVDGIIYTVYEYDTHKLCEASDGSYHYIFNKQDGMFSRWGKTEEDDPTFCPAGPEILDLEIASGKCSGGCNFCYKGNSASQEAVNMTFETFKKVINSIPKCLTQIALGICDIDGNPDFIKMMEYSRSVGIIPNFTLSGIGLTDEMAKKVSRLSGALAVSAYETDKNICYDTIKKFTDLGMNQVNCHAVVSEETLPFIIEVLNDRMHDPRLAEMNAIVFLGVKPKGRAKGVYHPLSTEKYASLVKLCFRLGIPFGFDSCSAGRFERAVDAMEIKPEMKAQLKQMSESCESSAMSAYINTYGEYFPCSFAEGEGEWIDGVDVCNCSDFLKDVWYNDKVVSYRERLINSMCNGCRKCLIFDEIN